MIEYSMVMVKKTNKIMKEEKMAEIALRNVCKQFNSKQYGVKDFNLDIHDKEFVIFVGPSGCGKSTTLRLIAGLEEITDGELWVDGEICNYLEPKEREMSMVFQNYALYPNMTVYGNIAYALKIRKVPKKEIDERVREVAKILEIESLLDRKPTALSGGQKQRVAIGAAIVRQPKAFLMDEPLSNLDAKLRTQMRVELQKLHKQLHTTIIYVTHDQTEAMTLGTKIVVMKDGMIQQVDTPKNIYNHPVYPTGQNEEVLRGNYMRKRVILGIRSEDIYALEEAEKKGLLKNSIGIKETVINREMLGAEIMLYFEEQDRTCAVRLDPSNQTKVWEEIDLYFDMEKIHIFDIDTEENILYRGR